jgi:hypothetical protein
MGIMQAELQEKRKWVRERFLEDSRWRAARRDGHPARHLPEWRAAGGGVA